ncbi:hypothetical protein HK096_006497, partial [Nowakowskiella sp. JEL0078]
MLFVIFKIDVPKWYPEFVTARSRSVSASFAGKISDDLMQEHSSESTNERMNLVDHYLAMLLIVFLEAGLIQALVELLSNNDKQMVTTATILIGEIMEMCNRLLPKSHSTNIQSLPTLFKIASDFEDESKRHTATLAFSCIDNLQKTKERLFPHAIDEQFNRKWVARTIGSAIEAQRANSVRIGRQQTQVRSRSASTGAVDDANLRSLASDTQIMSGKEYMLWNWDATLDLVKSLNSNSRRFEENSKLIRRLLSFYKPENHLFSDLKKTKSSATKFVRVGCEIMRSLVSIPEGIRFLNENKWIEQIAESLSQLNPMSTASIQGDPIFSKERMEKTLTADYFTMLGILSQSDEGLKLLEKFKIFDLFYHLTELRSRDDLVKAIISNLDYNIDGHSRVILSKVLTSGFKQIRIFATKLMRKLLRNKTNEFHFWAVPLLVTQLYDPVIEVCQHAVSILEESCSDERNLDAIVRLRPIMDHLGEYGNPLMLRFLSTPIGFQLLKEISYIGKEMGKWFEKGSELYVTKLELSLSEALSDGPKKSDKTDKLEKSDNDDD